MTRHVIVSRHAAAVEFIRREDLDFVGAPVIKEAAAEDVRGAVVAGNLPLHLAALAAEMYTVEFEGAPPRGQEYGLTEMDAAGARLARYIVLSAYQVFTLSAILPNTEDLLQWAKAQ